MKRSIGLAGFMVLFTGLMGSSSYGQNAATPTAPPVDPAVACTRVDNSGPGAVRDPAAARPTERAVTPVAPQAASADDAAPAATTTPVTTEPAPAVVTPVSAPVPPAPAAQPPVVPPPAH